MEKREEKVSCEDKEKGNLYRYTLEFGIRGIYEGFNNISGITVSRFENFAKEEISNYLFCIPRYSPRDLGSTMRLVATSPSSAFGKPLFPEICAGYGGQVISQPTLTVVSSHPSIGNLKKEESFEHKNYDYLCVKQGPKATIILKDPLGNSVMV